jgi:hypothetical protein
VTFEYFQGDEGHGNARGYQQEIRIHQVSRMPL